MAATTTFLQLQTELYARGFDYLNDGGAGQTRAKTWTNQAYLELCEEDTWPFLLTTASGAAPLAIADLASILRVTDTVQQQPLDPLPEGVVIDEFTPVTTAGPPIWFYLDDTTVRTYPVGGTLSVRYYKVPALLVANGDIAVVPDRFANLIVDGAVRRAHNDNDSASEAKQAEDERQRGLALMRQSFNRRDGMPESQRLRYTGLDW